MPTIHPDAPKVIVYSQPGCGPCTAVVRDLGKRGIPFEKVNIRQDPAAANRVRELGYSGTPVVEVGDMHWKDFRLAKHVVLAEVLEAWEPLDPETEGESIARRFLNEEETVQ